MDLPTVVFNSANQQWTPVLVRLLYETNIIYLDLLLADEAERRANGERLRDIKRDAAARLFNQAFEQDGVLTNAEVALLLKISPAT